MPEALAARLHTGRGASPALLDVGVENGPLQAERAVALLDEQHRDELLTDENLGGIRFLRSRRDLDRRVAEKPAQVALRPLELNLVDRHLQVEGAVAVLVVERDHGD